MVNTTPVRFLAPTASTFALVLNLASIDRETTPWTLNLICPASTIALGGLLWWSSSAGDEAATRSCVAMALTLAMGLALTSLDIWGPQLSYFLKIGGMATTLTMIVSVIFGPERLASAALATLAMIIMGAPSRADWQGWGVAALFFLAGVAYLARHRAWLAVAGGSGFTSLLILLAFRNLNRFHISFNSMAMH